MFRTRSLSSAMGLPAGVMRQPLGRSKPPWMKWGSCFVGWPMTRGAVAGLALSEIWAGAWAESDMDTDKPMAMRVARRQARVVGNMMILSLGNLNGSDSFRRVARSEERRVGEEGSCRW